MTVARGAERPHRAVGGQCGGGLAYSAIHVEADRKQDVLSSMEEERRGQILQSCSNESENLAIAIRELLSPELQAILQGLFGGRF